MVGNLTLLRDTGCLHLAINFAMKNTFRLADLVRKHFEPLNSIQRFSLTENSFQHVVLNGEKISIALNYNPREGCITTISQKGTQNSFDLDTLISALKTHHGEALKKPKLDNLKERRYIEEQLSEHVHFLTGDGSPIINGDPILFDELRKLRFWHAGKWVTLWGNSIRMSEETIKENRELVPRIERMLLMHQLPDTSE